MTDAIDLRCGDWRDVLADVGEVDAVITDPPYGARTHDGHRVGLFQAHGKMNRRDIAYASWGERDIKALVTEWAPRTKKWFCAMTSHDMAPIYKDHMAACGLYVFAPLPCVSWGGRVRLAGDGPSSWTHWLMVGRTADAHRWGTLPGAYVNRGSHPPHTVAGGKRLDHMRAIVGDYTNPGDVVVDPCAGGATTLIAAAELGCTAIGAELDPETFAKAQARIAKGYTPMPHPRAHKVKGKPKQGALW